MPTITGGHHIALTVSDVERSAAFYQDLLGMQQAFQGSDDTVSFVVLAHPDSGWVLGVREHHGEPKGRFDELRTGLDHFAFTVSSREELEAWVPEVERRGVTFSPIAETPIGSVIVSPIRTRFSRSSGRGARATGSRPNWSPPKTPEARRP